MPGELTPRAGDRRRSGANNEIVIRALRNTDSMNAAKLHLYTIALFDRAHAQIVHVLPGRAAGGPPGA
jgi:hypothetical protein